MYNFWVYKKKLFEYTDKACFIV